MLTHADCTDEILTDLHARIPWLVLQSCEDFDAYWEQVGFWLIQLEEAEFHRWFIRFAFTIHRYWGAEPEDVARRIQQAVDKAKAKEVLR